MSAAIADILRFWGEAGAARWFTQDAAFDAEFSRLFLDLHFAAARRECDHWYERADGPLALLILLDQLPRNVYRNNGHAFATDPLARHFAKKAIAERRDVEGPLAMQRFFYLPLVHSEAIEDQDIAVELMQKVGEPALSRAIGHRDIIRRFGRFPHRNLTLGRCSTEAELSFLQNGGFAG